MKELEKISYQEAAKRLKEMPKESFDSMIHKIWAYPWEFSEGCLFKYATKDGTTYYNNHEYGTTQMCGCLTQIRGDNLVAQTKELTDMIRADEHIPNNENNITQDNLDVFVEWQERLDRELRMV